MRAEAKVFNRGAVLPWKGADHVPAEHNIRPLRDVIILEPLEHTMSAIIHVIAEQKPVRGYVRRIGPGVYPIRYNGPKGKRTKMWYSKAFRPCDVKVGDLVELEPHRTFQTFYWGDRLHLMLREEDVAGVRS